MKNQRFCAKHEALLLAQQLLNRRSEPFKQEIMMSKSDCTKSIVAMSAATALAAACGNAPDGKAMHDETVGSVQIAIEQVPTDVHCLIVQAVGKHTARQSFDVKPGERSTLRFSAVPAGDARFSGMAYPVR